MPDSKFISPPVIGTPRFVRCALAGVGARRERRRWLCRRFLVFPSRLR